MGVVGGGGGWGGEWVEWVGGVTPYTICGGAVNTRHGTIYNIYILL